MAQKIFHSFAELASHMKVTGQTPHRKQVNKAKVRKTLPPAPKPVVLTSHEKQMRNRRRS